VVQKRLKNASIGYNRSPTSYIVLHQRFPACGLQKSFRESVTPFDENILIDVNEMVKRNKYF